MSKHNGPLKRTLGRRPVTPQRLRRDPAAFADIFLPFNEKGQAWRLSRHQRRVLARAFRRGPRGSLRFRLVLWSEPKKSGKTFLAAVLLLWWAFSNSDTEIVVAANDLDQSVSRVFKTAAALVKHNPGLLSLVTVRAAELRFSNGTVVTAIAGDYRGAAGARHSLVVFDEIWGFHSENAQRLYEELTPPITEANAWVLIVTYAGFTGESKLLEAIYQRGLAGTRVAGALEMYEADGLFMFWSHTRRQAWQTDAKAARYYANQERSLRPATFARLHRNEWVSAESMFITADLWDGCVDSTHQPLLANPRLQVVVGVDAAIKHDYASAQVMTWAGDGDQLIHVTGHIWKPSATMPLDLEETIEQYLWQLVKSYNVVAIYVDPYQMHRSITTLAKAGMPIREFPQTQANITRMSQLLFDLLRGKKVVLYPDPDLREQALHTVAIETGRGLRVEKGKASKKIDGIVAFSIACVAAVDTPAGPPLPTPEEEAEMERQERAFARWMGWPPAPYGGWGNYVGNGLSDPDEDYLSDHGRWFL
jgi:phage terminase large subunit-like protein